MSEQVNQLFSRPNPAAMPVFRQLTKYDQKSSKVLVLRTCKSDFTSHKGGFRWPKEGYVECPDWNPEPVCGGGLHGLLWGRGGWSLLDDSPDAVWQVVEVEADSIVDIDNQMVKFPRGNVIYSGSMAEAISTVLCHPDAMANFDQVANANFSTTSTNGKRSTAASSGNHSGASSAGDCSLAASNGNYSTASSSGYDSISASNGFGSRSASAGNRSRSASTGDCSSAASSGNYSIASASGTQSTSAACGCGSTASSSGYGSRAVSSGTYSRASAQGKDTIAIAAGLDCIVSAGENGCFAAVWWHAAQQRYRIRVGYVGRDGLKPNTPYRLNAMGQWVEVEDKNE